MLAESPVEREGVGEVDSVAEAVGDTVREAELDDKHAVMFVSTLNKIVVSFVAGALVEQFSACIRDVDTPSHSDVKMVPSECSASPAGWKRFFTALLSTSVETLP